MSSFVTVLDVQFIVEIKFVGIYKCIGTSIKDTESAGASTISIRVRHQTHLGRMDLDEVGEKLGI